jgi:hypothetical protein
VQAYFARLEFARRLSENVIDLQRHMTAGQKRSELEKLEDAWRHCCAAALAASAVIRACFAQQNIDAPPPANPIAAALLHAAGQGERPCVDAAGNVCVPGWAESRLAKRVNVNQKAIAYYRGLQQTITLENASLTGIGIQGLEQPIPGRLISVILSTGETLTGMIVWAHGRACGIKLNEPVKDDHPLLRSKPN